MKVLGIDTSSSVASVSVIDGDVMVGEFTINHPKTHSQKLMPLIKMMMDSLEIQLSEMDLIAVSRGPGSFTGVRIGMSAAKAFSHSLEIPIVSVSTLKSLAYNDTREDRLIVPIMDARRSETYTCIYEYKDGLLSEASEEMAISIEELAHILKEKNRPVLFMGDGVKKFRDYLSENLENIEFASPDKIMQKASTVAILGREKYETSGEDNLFDVEPNYIRKSQAERDYDKKHGVE
ncbi:MAG: tRNA (adenosine(37)-N6)-threonylcarbamoyltransferase complex dimerization subunit type 1 TsaB [Firmicutes bacterium]|jgi:tRNA threonylcarbamoyladenosine biosynthesis protein TsaB|nr:tRNA (adenosine(37)-N6)-threonylcarbamoyltransferase complex dimerization subunit type 1 TsaB [Bacillota bacterium]